METFQCPHCGSKAVGRVGHEQYYCWDCCLEYSKKKDGYRLYQVADDGTLVSIQAESEMIYYEQEGQDK